jgi:hypothetical protein
MDKNEYECVDCKTKRFLIYPKHNESFIICSACYRIRNEKKEEEKFIYTQPREIKRREVKDGCACSVCERHNQYLNKLKNEKQ